MERFPLPDSHNEPTSSNPEPTSSAYVRKTLMRLAFESVEHGIRFGRALDVNPADYMSDQESDNSKVLAEDRATFVTLNYQHQLVGCIGMLQPTRPLAVDVCRNAYSAAFEDPRTSGVNRTMLGNLEIHISILNEPVPMSVSSEADLLEQLRPGVDGLIFQEGVRRATFLPAVWESLPDPADFVSNLKRKAGFPGDHWSKKVQLSRYTVESIP